MNAFIAVLSMPRKPLSDVEEILVLLFAPPIMGCLFRLMAGGWAQTVQGGDVSSQTKDRQRFEFWLLVGALYVGEIMIFAFIYFFGVKS
ncbi:MAG: hypothetical protein WBX19_13330 [Terracidiphilus sp.]